MSRPFRTALIGFGAIGGGGLSDPLLKKYFQFSSHAEVLKEHDGFDWNCVVDPNDELLNSAKSEWCIPSVFNTVDEMMKRIQPEVVVLATPPSGRLDILQKLDGIRAILVEKPIALSLKDTKEFCEYCDKKGVFGQVNFWRRADDLFNEISGTKLNSFIGELTHVNAIYGNGLKNNGSHLIDFIQFLCGKVIKVQALPGIIAFEEGPIKGDLNYSAALYLEGDIPVFMQPVRFSNYREVSLDIYGTEGRLVIDQESLVIKLFKKKGHRSLSGNYELASDLPVFLTPTVSRVLYNMYDNMHNVLKKQQEPISSLANALIVNNVVDSIEESYFGNGKVVYTNA